MRLQGLVAGFLCSASRCACQLGNTRCLISVSRAATEVASAYSDISLEIHLLGQGAVLTCRVSSHGKRLVKSEGSTNYIACDRVAAGKRDCIQLTVPWVKTLKSLTRGRR